MNSSEMIVEMTSYESYQIYLFYFFHFFVCLFRVASVKFGICFSVVSYRFVHGKQSSCFVSRFFFRCWNEISKYIYFMKTEEKKNIMSISPLKLSSLPQNKKKKNNNIKKLIHNYIFGSSFKLTVNASATEHPKMVWQYSQTTNYEWYYKINTKRSTINDEHEKKINVIFVLIVRSQKNRTHRICNATVIK